MSTHIFFEQLSWGKNIKSKTSVKHTFITITYHLPENKYLFALNTYVVHMDVNRIECLTHNYNHNHVTVTTAMTLK